MNIKNLKILRGWLAAGNITQEQFNMERYRSGEGNLEFLNKKNRGTLGCILGWCPFIPKFSNYKSERFNYLAEELFEINVLSPVWSFLFSSDWVDYDNTIEGAIARLDVVTVGDFEG